MLCQLLLPALTVSFLGGWESEELTLMGREEPEQPAGFSGLKAGSSAGLPGEGKNVGFTEEGGDHSEAVCALTASVSLLPLLL